MFYNLIGGVKRRLMWELRDVFGRHPIYKKIVPFINQKYVFDERPQYGIVIQGASTTPQRLAPDNFVGTVVSYAMLASVGARPGHTIEWVVEDRRAVEANNGFFPTPPGVYFIETTREPADTDQGRLKGLFLLHPMLTVNDELLLTVLTGQERQATCLNVPVQGTFFLTANRRWPLKEGVEFTLDYTTGEVTFLRLQAPGTQLFMDYRYALQTVGPVEFDWNTSNSSILPGVILAFGRRAEAGTKQAVVVTDTRVDTAREYGGATEVSVDFDVIARDQDQLEEIADLCTMYIFGERQLQLASDGLIIQDFQMSGENSETYDETDESLIYHTASFSVTFRTEWRIHFPLPLTIRGVSYMSSDAQSQIAGLSDEDAAKVRSSIQMDSNLELTSLSVPYLPGRTWDFESLK